MSLQFYLGRAGSGKTHRCLQEIAERLRENPSPDAGPLIWLLPEQATAQAEASLLEQPGVQAFVRARVVSFRRLAHQVIEATGGAPGRMLDETGRRMLLHALVARHGDALRVFGHSARERGFVARLAALFRELTHYGVAFAELEAEQARLAEQGEADSLLARKLHDVVLLGRAWEERIQAGRANPDRFLDELARRLAPSGFFRDAEVWLDGFASLTPQQMRVVEQMLREAKRMRATLLLDPEALDGAAPHAAPPGHPSRLFSQTEETLLRMQDAARECGAEIEPHVVLPESGSAAPRFTNRPTLAQLEASLVENELTPMRVADAPGPLLDAPPDELPAVVCVEAANRREEIETAARLVRRVAREEGARWRDIAVLARDLEPYEVFLREAFERHDIPYFMDRRRSLAHHPLPELLRSAVRIHLARWQFEDVVEYLKTDLAPVERAEADLLENYALEHGVRGRAWWVEQPWGSREGADFQEIRTRAFDPLLALEADLQKACDASGACTARGFVRSVGALLERLACRDKLAAWSARDRERGEVARADEHEQIWAETLHLLEQMAAAPGEDRLSPADCAAVLESGLGEATMALVPPALDQVLVGSVDRSRQPPLQTVFLIGMNEHLFPKPGGEEPILSDQERETLQEESALELGPTGRVRLMRERYFAYVALTRASRRIVLSWSAADEKGRETPRSSFVDAALRDAAGFDEHPARVRIDSDWLREAPESVESPADAWEGMVRAANGDPNLPRRKVWRALAEAAGPQAGAPRNWPSLEAYRAARLDAALFAERLLPAKGLSVSRLETYAACPFQYLAKYALALEPRRTFQVEAWQVGEFHHELLSDVYAALLARRTAPPPSGLPDQLQKAALDWGAVASEDALNALHEAVERRRSEYLSEGPLGRAQTEFFVQRARRFVETALESLRLHGREDAFFQISGESPFGFTGSKMPALEIPLGEGAPLRLHGRIDRVDAAPLGDGRFAVRVVDYKSSARSLTLYRVLEGLSLQLPLYLAAVVSACGGRAEPAGAFYFPVRRDVAKESALPEKEGAAEKPEPIRMAGLLDRGLLELYGDPTPGRTFAAVKLKIKKDGDPDKRSDCAPEGALARLTERAAQTAVDAARRLRGGDATVAPYRLKKETPCRFCEFRDVCRIEPEFGWERRLTERKDQEIVDELFD